MGAGPVDVAIRILQQRMFPAFFLFALCACAGCATLPEQAPVSASDIAWVLAGGDTPVSGDVPADDLPALLHVTAEMRRFAQNATSGLAKLDDKAAALATALTAERGLHLQYDAGATLTAEQAFSQRRVNCLSYTLLFVALAREVGVPAKFNEVDIPPVWDMSDDKTLLLYRHVNARVDLTQAYFQIIDVSGDDYDPSFHQRAISDSAVLAQFYNNRAVELRQQQRYADALRYQLRALKLSPDAAYLWTNLAGLYLLNGSTRAAGIAIGKALLLDPANLLSYDTAAQVYAQAGDQAAAASFKKRAQHFLDQSPYYHYQLALAAFRDDNERLAYSETRRAILLYREDPRFFFLAAVTLERLGDTQHANDCLRLAIELTHDPAQQARYRNKFERLTAGG